MGSTQRCPNLLNMESIGITEQKVMDYTNACLQRLENEGAPPDCSDFYLEPISSDNLIIFREFDKTLDSLKGINP